MKKALLVFTFLFVFLSIGMAQNVPNGGFEDWTSSGPEKWLTSNNSQERNAEITRSSDAYEGAYAARGQSDAFTPVQLTFTGPLDVIGPGAPVTEPSAPLYFWYKFQSGDVPMPSNFEVEYELYNADLSILLAYGTKTFTTDADDWTQGIVLPSYTASDGEPGFASISFRLFDPSSGEPNTNAFFIVDAVQFNNPDQSCPGNLQGGTLSTMDPTYFCSLGGDEVNVMLSGASGDSMSFVLVNFEGEILQITDATTFDFAASDPDGYSIWNISYDSSLEGLEVGNNINDLSGCFNLSNGIPVIVSGATPDGGAISTMDTTTFCTGESDNVVVVDLSGDAGPLQTFLITDTVGEILSLSRLPSLDFRDENPGVYQIWHLSYTPGTSGIREGQNVSDIQGCFDFSDSIRVVKLSLADCIEVPAGSCLPDGLTFSAQNQIDSFVVNYPGCTTILGDVTIEETEDSTILSLNGLSVLDSLGGSLAIKSNVGLKSLSGLDGINVIPGDLELSDNAGLVTLFGLGGVTEISGSFMIQNCDSLPNPGGIGNLSSIGGDLVLEGNNLMTTLGALGNVSDSVQNLVIRDCPSLSAMTGLADITRVTGNLEIANNPELTTLSGLGGITEINGTFFLSNCASLPSPGGIGNLNTVGGDLVIEENARMTTLGALGNINTIGGSLNVINCDSLSNLTGLGGFSAVGGELAIRGNGLLTALDVLSNVNAVGGTLAIINNDSLTSLAGLGNIAPMSISNLIILDNVVLSECEVESVCAYLSESGTSTIANNAVGCATEAEVLNACSPPVARAQIVHNAPDPAADTVDIYILSPQDTLGINNFAFREATPFVDLPAEDTLNIVVAPAGSNGPEEGISSTELVLSADSTYYVVASGVLNPDDFDPNPEDIDIDFRLFRFEGALEEASGEDQVAINLFHGISDAPAVNVRTGFNSIVVGLSFGEYSGDFEIEPMAYELEMIVPLPEDTLILKFDTDLDTLGGQSALILASGFLNTEETPGFAEEENQNDPAVGLLIVTVDGQSEFLEAEIVTSVRPQRPAEIGLNLYPVPTGDILTAEWTQDKLESNQSIYRVINSFGQVIRQRRMDASLSQRIQIDMKGLPAGMYLFSLEHAGKSYTRTFVKQ